MWAAFKYGKRRLTSPNLDHLIIKLLTGYIDPEHKKPINIQIRSIGKNELEILTNGVRHMTIKRVEKG
jgi:hypothetical protein